MQRRLEFKVNQRCIRDGKVNLELARLHDESKRKVRDDKVLRNGDVVVCSTGVGTLGRTAGVRNLEARTTADSHVTIVRPNSNVDPDWLAYAMQFSEPIIEDMAQGSTGQTELSRADLALLELARPSFDLQVKIGKVLRLLDDKIESNSTVMRLAEQFLDVVAVAEGGNLPLVSIEEIADIQRKSVSIKSFGDGVVDHFSLPAFDEGQMPVRESASSIKSNKLRLSSETILVSRLNPRFNRTWFVEPDDVTPALASPEFAALTAKDGFGSELVWLAVRSQEFRNELPRRVTGTSGSHQRVRPDDLMKIRVPDFTRLEPLKLQETRQLLLRTQVALKESAALAKLRDSLLPELLSGRIAPNEIGTLIKSVEAAR